jgi:hypothetical protein
MLSPLEKKPSTKNWIAGYVKRAKEKKLFPAI